MMNQRKWRIAGLLGIFLVACLTGCGAPADPPLSAKVIASVDGIQISEPRARIPPGGRDVTAAYMTITNTSTTPNRIVKVSSLAAKKIEMHTHLVGPDGLKQMREIDHIELAPKQTILLAPGGLHLMIFGVSPSAVAQQSLPISLTFKDGATTNLLVPFVANPVSDVASDKGGSTHNH